MTEEIIQMVRESEDSPTMPAESWIALQQVRVLKEVNKILDEQNVPLDHGLRAKATRLVLALVAKKYESDIAEMQVHDAEHEAQGELKH